MGKKYNIILDKRIIDLSVVELLNILDERYVIIPKDKNLSDSAVLKSDFLNVKKCAELTGYTEEYIRQLVFKEKIPFYKVQDHTIRFSKREIIEWMTTKKYIPVAKRAQDYINRNELPNQFTNL
ncbi:MAG: helix-turn-helix domain-containing protein [Bacteroidetes bacterium]|jgi:excisionase family DNA binding protein|nr:helix-turn-helix domain-containing protein [Bacteroidota bacterium]